MVPTDWKDATSFQYIPIYKGRTKSTATNYKPISLTSQLCSLWNNSTRSGC